MESLTASYILVVFVKLDAKHLRVVVTQCNEMVDLHSLSLVLLDSVVKLSFSAILRYLWFLFVFLTHNYLF
jgi:hypothetical protein